MLCFYYIADFVWLIFIRVFFYVTILLVIDVICVSVVFCVAVFYAAPMKPNKNYAILLVATHFKLCDANINFFFQTIFTLFS